MTIHIPKAVRTGYHDKTRTEGFLRPSVLLLLLVVLAVTTFLLIRYLSEPPQISPPPPPQSPVAQEAPESRLSQATLRVLRQLQSPVEIRFYTMLDDGPATIASRSLADRVEGLLAEYEKAAGDWIQVSREEARTSSAESAARKDGMAPLPGTKRGTNFLGIALSCGEQRAVLPSLTPEWEEALEFDLSRAILQITSGLSGNQVVLNPTPESFAARDELRQTFPEMDSLSLDAARKQVQAAGLEEYKEAVAGFRIQLNEAQQNLALARDESPAAVEAALAAMKALQTRQSDQLRIISQRMQARLAALNQIKSGGF